jgi:hypothetical protein
MNNEHAWASVSPEFGPGDTAYTSWGKRVTIQQVEVTMIITYVTDGDTVWQADELQAAPPVTPDCTQCGQMALFRDELGLATCENCRKL